MYGVKTKINSDVAVGEAPEILDELTDQTITTPDKAVLKCAISRGDPVAELHWFHNDREVYKGKKYIMEAEEDDVSLTIKETDAKDGGFYRCEASNKLGRVQTQCCVTVVSKCFSLPLCSDCN